MNSHKRRSATANMGPLTVATTTWSWPGAAAIDDVQARTGARLGHCFETRHSPQVGIRGLREWIAGLPQRTVLACSGPNAMTAAEEALGRGIGVFLERPPARPDANRLARISAGRGTYFAPLRWQLLGAENFLFERCRGHVHDVELRYPAEDAERGIDVALHHMVDASPAPARGRRSRRTQQNPVRLANRRRTRGIRSHLGLAPEDARASVRPEGRGTRAPCTRQSHGQGRREWHGPRAAAHCRGSIGWHGRIPERQLAAASPAGSARSEPSRRAVRVRGAVRVAKRGTSRRVGQHAGDSTADAR